MKSNPLDTISVRYPLYSDDDCSADTEVDRISMRSPIDMPVLPYSAPVIIRIQGYRTLIVSSGFDFIQRQRVVVVDPVLAMLT